MRRFLVSLILILLLVNFSLSQGARNANYTFRSSGTSDGINLIGTGVAYHHFTAYPENLSACSVKLESSPDNSTWSDLIGATTCTSAATSAYTQSAANYVRVNVTSLTASSSAGKLTVNYNGYIQISSAGSSVTSATFKAGGADPIALDTLAAPTDITTLNATTSLHGLLPKLGGVATTYLNGAGAWTTPPDTTYTGTANQIVVTGTTLSTPQNINTTSTPSFVGLGLTTGQLTHTQGSLAASTPFITHTATWNAGTTVMTDHFVNITDTASGALSLLLDLQVGSASKFKVDKTGLVTAPGGFSTVANTALITNISNTAIHLGTAGTYLGGNVNGIFVATTNGANFGIRLQFAGIPTIASGFGVGAAVSTGSTDTAGQINIGTGGTAQTGVINFITTWPRAPFCTVLDKTTGAIQSWAETTTTLTITGLVPWTASDNLVWHCIGSFV